MSGGATAAAGAVAAAAAAAALRRMQEEEERLTEYNKDDLNGWEFKIVRANTRKFKNPEAVRQLCAEEAKAGWEMIEKFDDTRIRFKRPIGKRAGDQFLDVDPYRTHIGITEGQTVVIVLGVLLLAAGIAALIFLGLRG